MKDSKALRGFEHTPMMGYWFEANDPNHYVKDAPNKLRFSPYLFYLKYQIDSVLY